jgi:uncharacterized protein DUF3987/bifunctional DNA primase/polymerase-like protein
VTARKLSATEYSHQLEELLGVPPLIRINGKHPLDDAWSTGPRLDPAAWRVKLERHTGNLGMLTGALRGGGYLVVVDADARVPEWEESLNRLYALGLPRNTVTVLTGGGGVHLYYVSPVPITKGALRDFPGIDIQCVGAQVVVPYSVHPDTGREYAWEWEYGPEDRKPEALPEPIIMLFNAAHVAPVEQRGEIPAHALDTVRLLEDHFGAHSARDRGRYIEVTRPGKERSASGTVGALEDRSAFYCHTSSWSPFEKDHAYTHAELRKLAHLPSVGAQLAEHIAIAVEEWEDALDLEETGPLPSFTVHALPTWLATYVEALADAKQTPLDLTGTLALAVLAAGSGGHALVSPLSGWAEYTNLFAAVAMRSGEGKSPVFSAMTKPLREWERDRKSASASDVVEATNARDLARSRAKQAKTAAAKEANAGKRAELLAEANAFDLEADATVIPVPPMLLCRDVTPEALEALLFINGGAMALMSPEGGVFDNFAGRYSKGPANIDVFLSGHDGEELRVHRIGRGSFIVPNAVLTIGATFQPAVLQRAARVAINVERGVLARFLFVKPTSMRGYRNKGAKPVSTEVEREYFERMYFITEELAHYSGEPLVMSFTNEATAALIAFDQGIETRMRPGGDLEHVAAFASKLAGTVARIAALLHIAHEAEPARWRLMVELVNVERAIDLGEYFLAHHLGVMRYAHLDATIEEADRVLRWAIRRGAPSFTRREAQQGVSGFVKADQLDAPLAELVERGWLRRAPQERSGPKGGRPPAPRFEVHPRARELYRRSESTHYGTDETS